MSVPKILIIDDDPDLVETMRITLEGQDYKVVASSSGEEGLKKVREENPSLVILDVMMETDSKGFDVAREMRKFTQVPILMLTALRERTGFDFSKEAGDETWLPVDAYLAKPLRPDRLLNVVRELLER